MRVELVDIEDVKEEWQTAHRVKALAVNGRSPALDALADWKKNQRADYKKIVKALRLAAANDRVLNENHVKWSPDQGVGEMRAHRGHARLFFFYTEDEEEIVVCTNAYWKAKPSRAEQDTEFRRCAQFKRIYRTCWCR